VAAAARLPGVRLGLVTCEPVDGLPPVLREHLAGHWRVGDALDAVQLTEATAGLGRQLGTVQRLVGALEQLQVPLAQVRAALGITGMDVATALNVRDKARMKSVLRQAGIPCARHRLVSDPAEAWEFAAEVGFPLVAKPPAGAGSQATYRLDDVAALTAWVQALPPSQQSPGLLEEFLTGEEHTYDAVTLDGTTGWASVSDYLPQPLTVLRNPWMQWAVLLPRDVTGPRYAAIHRIGPAALRALGVRDGLAHMEWFTRPDGTIAVSEVAARPPGGQLASMIGYAYEVDFYSAWAALMLLDRFAPTERRFAVGAAYLRGQGRGRVRAVTGIEQLQRDLGDLVVEARLPEPGQPASGEYTGEGYVIVRDPSTDVVREALGRIVSTARVELVESL
jgi:D-alanine-D-alanine ligase-like ATP-grasp enzyme